MTSSLEESDNLPDPDVIAQETNQMRIVECARPGSNKDRKRAGGVRNVITSQSIEDLESALEQFREIVADLRLARR